MESNTPSDARMRRVRRRRWCGGRSASRERPGIKRERLGALVDGGVAMELPPVASSVGSDRVSGGTVCRPEDQRRASASVPTPRGGFRPCVWRESATARSGGRRRPFYWGVRPSTWPHLLLRRPCAGGLTPRFRHPSYRPLPTPAGPHSV